MKDRAKKLISMIAATTVLGSTLAFAACGEENFTGKKLDGYVSSQSEAVSNGGFAVQKDNYVYYVNGAEDYSASNKYGSVKKGALMRISTTDLENGNYENTQTVVPMLLVSQDYDSGIYIYGDYVYYATPTTDKDVEDGTTRKDWIDFKCAKLDGSWAMSDYYFRLSDNSANFRYVQEDDGVVYCMYEDDGALKSFNTKTGKTHVLVEGATNLTYDMKDLSNGTVYYTMGVTFNLDSESSNAAPYNQIYKVSASATAKSISNGYETSNGKKYTFDTDYLEDNYKGFKKDNYKTYPYVNLGELVLDGIGSNYTNESALTQYNEKDIDFTTVKPTEISGYTYTVTRNDHDGVYFTRTAVNDTTTTAALYYLENKEDGKNTVSRNESLLTVAKDASKVSSAYFYGVDDYVVLEDSNLVRVEDGVQVILAYNQAGSTLWKTEGDYLYYYATGTNGYNLSRINYTGKVTDAYDPYNPLIDDSEYDPITFSYVDWNSSWYKPEFFGNKLLYSGAQSLGATAYKYIYAVDVPEKNADLEKLNEKYDEVQDYFSDIDDSDHKNAMKYVFATGEKTLLDEVESLYETVQISDYTAFAAHAKNEGEDVQNGEDYSTKFKDEDGNYYDRLSYYVSLVGGEDAIKDKDKDAIKASWASTLPSETETKKESSFPAWAIVLIVVGSVIVVAAAITVPVVLHLKKKAKRRAAIESTRVRKPRLDTTDDKSIDVYADDEETPVEEAAKTQEAVEETPVEEPVTEETVETEAVAEEAADVAADENKAE